MRSGRNSQFGGADSIPVGENGSRKGSESVPHGSSRTTLIAYSDNF